MWGNLSRLTWMRYLDVIPFKHFWLYEYMKNYHMPAVGNVFHNRNLTFTNEKSSLSKMIFWPCNCIIQKLAKMDVYAHVQTSKQSPSRPKLKKELFMRETWLQQQMTRS